MPDASLSEKLSNWLTHTRSTGIPSEVLAVAQIYILDWLGCALAGTATVPGSKLLAYARDQPGGPCHIIGTDRGGSPEVAALVNGGLSHIVEMDDVDRGSIVHAAAVIIPAALATAMYCGASGADLLSAIVAGYEVAIRIGEQVGRRHYYYFHNTSTCGVFGAAAATSWLLDLDASSTADALGNAGTQASGLWEFNAEGAMSKHLHAGRAASNGVLAGLLAREGFTGARRILEGDRGFFAALAPDASPEKVVRGLDEPQDTYRIERVSLKPHASCRHTHPAIDIALRLRPEVNIEEIERVKVDTYQAALDLCDNPRPDTPYEGKFSLQYCVAAALLWGQAGLEQFSPTAISDPVIRELLSSVAVGLDLDYEARYPAEWPTKVTVESGAGQSLCLETAHPLGDPEHPLTPVEVREKFLQMAAYSGFESRASALAVWVDSLPEARQVAMRWSTG